MAQYIDKSALVVEIEKLKKRFIKQDDEFSDGYHYALKLLISFLDTLEVKEVGVDLGDPRGDIGVKTVWDISNSLEISQHGNPNIGDDLEDAATKYAHDKYLPVQTAQSFKAGAQWQKEQFEKNRLEHCDSITEEQYNLETGFIDYYLDKYNRMPTFLDAIEYGMKKAMEE